MSKVNREIIAIRERAERQRAREAEQAKYYKVLSDWTVETHARMFREFYPLYAYIVPSTATEYGRLVAVGESADAPANAELITAEQIPRNASANQLLRWITNLSGRLPMYPTGA